MKLNVRALPEAGFFRCGRFFPHQGVSLPALDFTEEEVASLMAEANLVVQFEADENDPVLGEAETTTASDAASGETVQGTVTETPAADEATAQAKAAVKKPAVKKEG